MALGVDRVQGPLKGYHHYAFAVRLDPTSPLADRFHWLKLREPRTGALWHDARCFPEDELLRKLWGQVPRIPAVSAYELDGGWVHFAAFIEGTTLDRLPEGGGRVAERFMRQIEQLFAALAGADIGSLAADDPLNCGIPQSEGCTNSTAFLRGLVHFSAVHAYGDQRKAVGDLLSEFGACGDAWDELERDLPQLTARTPQLLHGDLHRKNFVVDRRGGLWTIDWELALHGDPLYDLATHLHLMRYLPDQERDMIRRWKRAVGESASRGAEEDLAPYLAYKRLQSVYTDIMRGSVRLCEEPGPKRLRAVTVTVRRALVAAQEPLRMAKIPTTEEVEAALSRWCEWHSSHSAADVPAVVACG